MSTPVDEGDQFLEKSGEDLFQLLSITSHLVWGRVVPDILDTAVYYADGRLVAYETLEEAVRARHGPNTFVAVALHEPDQKELGLIANELGLSKQLIADAINPPHRAGIQQHENLLSIWLASVRYPRVEEGVRIGWICMLVEEGLLVTLHFGEGLDELKNVRRRVEDEHEQLWETPLDVLREMVDEVFDGYDEAVENLDGEVAQTERAVFDGKPDVSRRIHALTRVVVELRQAIEPLGKTPPRESRVLCDGSHGRRTVRDRDGR